MQEWADFLVVETAISESFIFSYAQKLTRLCPLHKINSLSDVSFYFIELPLHRREVKVALTKYLEKKKSLANILGKVTLSLIKLVLFCKYDKLESFAGSYITYVH
jgi:hypothetical protein